ncbi:MAG TPA: NERD domain-containing protein [Streptosporangiaceae bacterium]
MDAEVHDPPGQPAQQANEVKGLRALFGNVPAHDAAERADPGTATAMPEDADQAGRADGTADGTADRPKARAVRSLRKGPGLLADVGTEAGAQTAAAQPAGVEPAEAQPAGVEPADAQPSAEHRFRPADNRALASALNSRPLTSRPLIGPHLRSDPRLRIWITRLVVAFVILVGFTIGLSWRVGLTAAIIYIAADSILRSKTTSVVPAGVRVTSAQRFTRRRLKVLQPSGYVALHARAIPGTRHVIDHVVVGPAGVFTLDSQRLDRRLPIRARDGMLYHGRTSMEERFDHARHEARHAATLITAELGQRVRVRPVMVLYGPSISWMIMKVKGVDVFDGSRVGTYFRRQSKAVGKHRLNHSQIAEILAAAAQALPPLE